MTVRSRAAGGATDAVRAGMVRGATDSVGAGVVAVVLVGFVTCGSGTTGESAVTAVVVVLLFGAVGVDARVWKVMSV